MRPLLCHSTTVSCSAGCTVPDMMTVRVHDQVPPGTSAAIGDGLHSRWLLPRPHLTHSSLRLAGKACCPLPSCCMFEHPFNSSLVSAAGSRGSWWMILLPKPSRCSCTGSWRGSRFSTGHSLQSSLVRVGGRATSASNQVQSRVSFCTEPGMGGSHFKSGLLSISRLFRDPFLPPAATSWLKKSDSRGAQVPVKHSFCTAVACRVSQVNAESWLSGRCILKGKALQEGSSAKRSALQQHLSTQKLAGDRTLQATQAGNTSINPSNGGCRLIEYH